MSKKLDIKHHLCNQILAETLVDHQTGEVLAQEGEKIDRKLLNKLIPFPEKEEEKLGEESIELPSGILDEPIRFQSIKVVDPTDPEGERVLNVIGMRM